MVWGLGASGLFSLNFRAYGLGFRGLGVSRLRKGGFVLWGFGAAA